MFNKETYVFGLYVDGGLVSRGKGVGSNALEAFEMGLEAGTVRIQGGQKTEVIARKKHGKNFFKFEAGVHPDIRTENQLIAQGGAL